MEVDDDPAPETTMMMYIETPIYDASAPDGSDDEDASSRDDDDDDDRFDDDGGSGEPDSCPSLADFLLARGALSGFPQTGVPPPGPTRQHVRPSSLGHGAYRAFRRVDRGAFVPERVADAAYLPRPESRRRPRDRADPLASYRYDDAPLRSRDEAWDCVVHMSAPSIYAAALEALDLEPRMSFLNCGAGSGYFSALCATLLGPHAVHHCVERCANLAKRRESLRPSLPPRRALASA